MYLTTLVGNESELQTAQESRSRFIFEFEYEMAAWQKRSMESGTDQHRIDSELDKMYRLHECVLSHSECTFWIKHRRDSARMICKAVEGRIGYRDRSSSATLSKSLCS